MDRRLTSVGTLMPHASAKVVNADGEILPIGSRGELCIAGYQLQQGYWRNEEKTAETMKRDADGVLWLHTGDEAFIDAHGYCKITGRFKDIIIRGGENIYPLEIEERLVQYPAVDRAILRLGAYEVLFSTDVPEPVAISEWVGLATELSTDDSPRFVNGLLARLAEVKPTLA